MKINVKEKADIEEIRFLADRVEVRGYQSYDIRKNSIRFMEKDSHDWADTRLKTRLLELVILEKMCTSYLDFGSNLGVLVFKASMQGVNARGIDYNQDYTSNCEKIAGYLNLQHASFYSDTFEYFKACPNWDLISLMNIHHHLFGRTDLPMSLLDINQSVLKKCKWFLTQFPTELDKKASKWTTLFRGIGSYSRQEFMKSLGGREFTVLYDSDTRPILLVRGDLAIP